MAAKKSKKSIATTGGDEPVSKTDLTVTIAAKFTASESARIDAILDTDVGAIPKSSFVRNTVLKALREREAAAAG